MVDPEHVIKLVDLVEGDTVLDLGCSSGDYSIIASRIVTRYGKVITIDSHKNSIEELQIRIKGENIDNLSPIVTDFTKGIPLSNGSVDIVLMFNVFHGLVYNDELKPIIQELRRVMKKGARLSILEFKKGIEGKGPPESVRLSKGQIMKIMLQYGFVHYRTLVAGHYHLLMSFII
ncbi:MAG: class I SAM-dependent methyltransferase [Candidatus Thermoplasmatota archaeon]|nr:class I SAM-dependent methyltransferase [Candidatus Thermoplasmatota archaeon]